jgi:hypothetical protein
MDHVNVRKAVRDLYEVVRHLEAMFPGRPFTPDGHLVGSLGECLVADAYALELMPPSNEGFDGLASDGRKVEIKATQSNKVAFRSCPDFCIVIRINPDGSFTECFNGPGRHIWREFEGKKRPSNGQYQISTSRLSALQKHVPASDQIQRL